MPTHHAEECKVHENLIALWIRQAIYFDGWFKVSNNGKSYVLVANGKYIFCDNGLIKHQRKSKQSMQKILHGLVDKYQSFQREGFHYYFSRGARYRHLVPEEELDY